MVGTGDRLIEAAELVASGRQDAELVSVVENADLSSEIAPLIDVTQVPEKILAKFGESAVSDCLADKSQPHDAIAEIHMFATNSYEWVAESDIEACFDNIWHSALLERIRIRVGDKRVVGLVKAFLKAGILSEGGITRDTNSGRTSATSCGGG